MKHAAGVIALVLACLAAAPSVRAQDDAPAISMTVFELRGGAYEYSRGFNWKAIAALGLGAAGALIGLVVPPLRFWYDYSWFVGFIVSFTSYYILMAAQRSEN